MPCLALLLGATAARAQDSELDPYRDRIQSIAHELMADLRPALDVAGREIIDSVSVEAPLSWVTNASAQRSLHRRRVVEFNAGLLAVTDWLAQSMIAEHEGYTGCLEEYSSYLVRVARKNSKRVLRGQLHNPVADFEEYAQAFPGPCREAHVDIASKSNLEFRERILDGVVATVLLHELAHHVLGHVDSNNRGFIIVHMRESAADQWAIRMASRMNYDLRASVPLFLFLAASGGGSLEDDIRSTHPSGLRRVRDLLVQTREILQASDPTSAHRMDRSIEELNHSLLN